MPWSNQAVSLVVIIAGGGFTGLFVYSGAPATGNLIASVAAVAGTDPYGNVYNAGVFSYAGGGEAGLESGALVLEALNAVSPGTLTATAPGVLDLQTGLQQGGDTVSEMFLYSLGASPSGAPLVQLGQATTLVASTPGTATAETWNTLGGGLGIANLTSDHGRYRFTPEGEVEIDVLLRATGAVVSASGTFANSLVSAYRPAFTRSYPLGGPVAAGLGRVLVSTAGAVTVTVPNLNSGNVMGTTIIMPTD
jgi:hypothetical protein